MNPKLEPFLRSFADEVESVFGNDLVSLCAFDSSTEEANVLIVLRNLGAAEMRKLAGPVENARKDCIMEILLFTPLDLHRSSDAMPLRLRQAQKNRVLLKGEDVMKSVFVEPEHLRIALERECKNILLKLRQVYLTRRGLRPAWQDALCDTAMTVNKLIGVALELTGHPPDAAEKEIGMRQDTLLKIAMMRVNPERISHEELEKLYEDYLEDVARLARFSDKLSQV